MMDTDQPVTVWDDACYAKIRSSFAGSIWETAEIYHNKAFIPDRCKGHVIIASTEPGERLGALMSDYPETWKPGCKDGSITGRKLLGKVYVK